MAQSGRSGVETAEYRRVFDMYHTQVLAYCARRVGRDDAEDAAAEVFTVAWRRIDSVPAGSEALPWLYGVAYNVVSHHWRGKGRSRRLALKLANQPLSVVSEPGNQVVQHADYERVLEAATRLRALDQEVLRLAVWEELRHDEIAEVLGCSVTAARQRFHRAKRSLLREYVRLGGTVPIPSVAPKGGEL
jgi:RNA polymerase sigma-70 factor (ECF subfamily)